MPRLDWKHRTSPGVPTFKIGQIITLAEHPGTCSTWRVTKTDGVIVDLTATEPCTPQHTRRFARLLGK